MFVKASIDQCHHEQPVKPVKLGTFQLSNKPQVSQPLTLYQTTKFWTDLN